MNHVVDLLTAARYFGLKRAYCSCKTNLHYDWTSISNQRWPFRSQNVYKMQIFMVCK